MAAGNALRPLFARAPTGTYRFCEVIVVVFILLATVHTVLLRQLGGPALTTEDALFLSQTLMGHRAWLTMALGLFYAYCRVTAKDCSQLLTVSCVLAWFIFIEDTLALDNVLFVPEMLSGQLTQFSRPFLLVALTYMAVESRRRRSHG
jgi:hypothetical protein